jgi:ribosomal protein S8
MPLASTNSRAISAACHPSDKDTRDGYLFPVTWGVTEIENGIGHCTITTAADIMTIKEADANGVKSFK